MLKQPLIGTKVVGLLELELGSGGDLEARPVTEGFAQRTVGIMFANQGDGRAEIRIVHAGHGYKQLIIKGARIVHATSIVAAARIHNRQIFASVVRRSGPRRLN